MSSKQIKTFISFLSLTLNSVLWSLRKGFLKNKNLKKIERFRESEKPSIAVFHQGGIGSGLMLGPMLQALRSFKPKATITLFSWQSQEGELLKAANLIDHYKVINPKKINDEISQGFDLLLSAVHTYQGCRVARRIPAIVKIGLRHSAGWDRKSFLYHDLGINTSGQEHEVQWDTALLKPLMVRMPQISPNLLPEDFLKSLDTTMISSARGYIALHCGGGKNLLWKRYSLEKLIEAARLVQQEFGVRILVIAGPDEQDEANSAVKEIGESAEIFDATGSIINSLAMLRNALCLISNDSMLMHLAAAAQCPTALIIGPTNPFLSGPWCQPTRLQIIRTPLYCSPCYRLYSGTLICTNSTYLECLKSIKPHQILESVKVLLQKK